MGAPLFTKLLSVFLFGENKQMFVEKQIINSKKARLCKGKWCVRVSIHQGRGDLTVCKLVRKLSHRK